MHIHATETWWKHDLVGMCGGQTNWLELNDPCRKMLAEKDAGADRMFKPGGLKMLGIGRLLHNPVMEQSRSRLNDISRWIWWMFIKGVE